MNIKSKLITGFLVILTILLILGSYTNHTLLALNSQLTNITQQSIPNVKLMFTISDLVSQYRITEYNHISSMSSIEKMMANETLNNTKKEIDSQFNIFTERITDQQKKEVFNAALANWQLYQELHGEIIALSAQFKAEEARELMVGQSRAVFNELSANLASLVDISNENAFAAGLYGEDLYASSIKSIIVFIALAVITGIAISFITVTSITKPIRKLQETAREIAAANYSARSNLAGDNELAQTGQIFDQMIDRIVENNWVKDNAAEFLAMYQRTEDLRLLATSFISKVTPLVGASYGVFYESDDEEKRLVATAHYAQQKTNKSTQIFYFGQGLVGQCALDKQTIKASNLPPDYISIRSGLGSGGPKNLICLPITYEGKVMAVVELASFQDFTKNHFNLLEEIRDYLGITIYSIKNRMEIARLLSEAQVFTEELQTQSEELQMQQEELSSVNEHLEEQIKSSQERAKELEEIKKELERKNSELVQSSKYKSEFLANMSHELRTPLNSLLILAQILLENKERNLNNKQLEYVKTIYSSGHDLLNLINNILDLSRVEAGKLEIDEGLFNLYDLIEDIKKTFSPIAQEKWISFIIDFSPNLQKAIYTDQYRLKQIVTNLLANAFKFTPAGTVRLAFKEANREGIDYLLVQVEDTGIGIPREQQQLIFEAFHQADGSTSRKFGGSGLGLSISRELAHMLGGYITVNSQGANKGSTFTLYLPQNIKKNHIEELSCGGATQCATTLEYREEPLLSTGSVDVSLQGKRVLLVDDDIRNVFALTGVLEDRGLEIIYAENGKKALETLDNDEDIDLVLMDIMMPEMDGYEAMQIIRSNPKFESLPIIAITAKAMKDDRTKCIAAGASDYISKPIDIGQLLSIIKVWLYK